MEKIPGMNFLIEGVVKYVDVQGLAEVARQSGRNALDGALVAAQLASHFAQDVIEDAKVQQFANTISQAGRDVVENAALKAQSLAKDTIERVEIQDLKNVATQRGKNVADGAVLVAQAANKFTMDNPSISVLAMGAFAIGTVCVVGPGIIASPLLTAGGLTSNGVVGGSIAATVQSSIGNVVAGSTFATLQSAGAGGPGLAAVNAAIQLAGGGIASAGGLGIAMTPQGEAE